MKFLEKVGLIGIGYILKDCGAFYPSSRRGSYYGYFRNGDSKNSPGEKIKKMLTEKLTTVIEKAIYGSEGTGYAVPEIAFTHRYNAEFALDDMLTFLKKYGVLSVYDYYECCENHKACKFVLSKYTDTRYGWYDIQDFRIVLNRDGMYIIKTPTPKLIKHDRKPISYSEYYKSMSKNEPEHEFGQDHDFFNEITYSEFLNEHNDYLKETISIYKDCVVDENYGCLMEHPEKLIGEENYRRICKNMSDYDWGAYYIRNDELKTDFEVTVYNESYTERMGEKKPEKHEVKIESLERDEVDFE